MSKYLSILTLSLTLLIIGCENKQNGAIYRVTTYEFNPEKFDEMIAYAQGMKDDVLRIEGLIVTLAHEVKRIIIGNNFFIFLFFI